MRSKVNLRSLLSNSGKGDRVPGRPQNPKQKSHGLGGLPPSLGSFQGVLKCRFPKPGVTRFGTQSGQKGGEQWGWGVPCTKGSKAGRPPAVDLGSPPPSLSYSRGKGLAWSQERACWTEAELEVGEGSKVRGGGGGSREKGT